MIRIIQVGLGPLGQKTVQFLKDKKNVKIVGAVDIDESIIGKDLGKHCGLKPMGVNIKGNLKSALGRKKADVAVLTTQSSLKSVAEQINEAAELGLNVVSTCEELSYPWNLQPALAKKIDRICKKNNVACLGTGVVYFITHLYAGTILSVVRAGICPCLTGIREKITRLSPVTELIIIAVRISHALYTCLAILITQHIRWTGKW